MESKKENNFNRYIAGGLIGAVIGIFAAFLINRSSEFEGEEFRFSGKKASKFALGTISLLWSLIEKGKNQ